MNFIIDKILKYVFGKLDGKKTYIGGICYILAALLGLVQVYMPEVAYTAIPTDLPGVLEDFGIGFGIIGGGHKVNKLASTYVATELSK